MVFVASATTLNRSDKEKVNFPFHFNILGP